MPAYARNPFFSAGYIAFQGDDDFFAATPSLPLTIFPVEARRGGTGRRPTGRAIAASWPGSTSIFTPDPRPGTGRWRTRQVAPPDDGASSTRFRPRTCLASISCLSAAHISCVLTRIFPHRKRKQGRVHIKRATAPIQRSIPPESWLPIPAQGSNAGIKIDIALQFIKKSFKKHSSTYLMNTENKKETWMPRTLL